MTTLLFNLDEVAPRIDRENLSAWFTPPALARRMVAWCGDVGRLDHILEPSAGRGSLVEAIRERSDAPYITAHELDPRSVAWLRNLAFPRVDVIEGDYLAAPVPIARYELAVMNPPYEDGQDGAFLEKAMDESDRVVALLRLVALAGQERYRRVWSRVGDGREFTMAGLAILSARPDFGGEDGAKADFAVVKLTREQVYGGGRTAVEWW